MPTAPDFPSLPQVLETIESLTTTLLEKGAQADTQELTPLLEERQQYVDWLLHPDRQPDIQAMAPNVFQAWMSRISTLDRQMETMFETKSQQQGGVLRHMARSREALKHYYVAPVTPTSLRQEERG